MRTDPSGATVWLDDKKVGLTPWKDPQIPSGDYSLRLALPDYYEHAVDGKVEDGKTTEVQEKLKPAFGTLTVTSEPSGATVWLDGKRLGQTPWPNAKRSSGRYELRVTLADYLKHEATLVVEEGKKTSHHAVLEANFGLVEVRSTPPGARIALNGEDTGKVTPHRFPRVPAGLVEITLTLEGYGDKVLRPKLARGGRALVDETLDAKLGELVVLVTDDKGEMCEATVSLDGVQQEGTTPLKLKLPAKSYTVQVTCGGPAARKVVAVAHNEKITLNLKVSSLKAVVGHSRGAGTGGSAAGMAFVRIPAGSFTMGCTAGQSDCGSDEKPAHSVRLSNDFLMGKTEVTQGQWKALMGRNPSHSTSCGVNCPVEEVQWWGALRFANKVSAAEGLAACYAISRDGDVLKGGVTRSVTIASRSGKVTDCEGYRLPTEAEWEYAARGGQDLLYSGSNTASDVAWYYDNSSLHTHPVATKQPNAWGLYDMSGNVWEWTWDWYDRSYYSNSSGTDPEGPNSGSDRVERGGGWYSPASRHRVANRNLNDPRYFNYAVGFRLARTLP